MGKLDWNQDVEQKIYRDWGKYYSHRRMNSTAIYYFDKALELNESDYKTLYNRCQTQRKAARIESALADARKAAIMAKEARGPNMNINLEICCELFELNKFVTSKRELQNNLQIFKGNEAKEFMKRLVVVDSVIKDVTGKAMTLFLRHQNLIQRADNIYKAKAIKDERLLWKRLSDQGKCDVVSIPEIEEEILSPLEISRRKRAFNVLHQTYINESWYDIYYMKHLRKNPSLLLEQCKRSRGILESLSMKQYEIIKQFMKMLQSRSPLYVVNFLKYQNKKMLEKNKEVYLFRIQSHTYRNMIQDLRLIRKMRREKKIKNLSDYVEKIMGGYYVRKTNRVMCWKFEFINEVYNTLALALSEQYYVPKYVSSSYSTMWQLLRLPRVVTKDIVPFVFGDRATYQEGDDQDIKGKKFRKFIAHLENRIRFSKFHIEKCYLYHQIADTHLSQGHYDECCFNARIAIKECRECNSLIWHFLSVILIVKANAMQHKLEQTGEALEMCLPIVQELRSPRLIKFVEMCIFCINDEVSKKLTLISTRLSKSSIKTRSSSTTVLNVETQ
ncbi:uncharacterized protein LOC117784096 [Drosophila innubila]|uniref:uncharacterized protein LOC117784096 n=1 Tax=Drosophila innubila TaxID=198719 RepID=UPI00148D63AA|nr:uncharacterized protein LOC117784096 [Drosophila innubila]